MRNVSDKYCSENHSSYFMSSKFLTENRAVYEMMWEICFRARRATDGSIIRRMRIACWVTKATETCS